MESLVVPCIIAETQAELDEMVNKVIGKNITNPTNLATKPAKSCFACGSTDFWLRPDGGWVCNRCHPKPGGLR